MNMTPDQEQPTLVEKTPSPEKESKAGCLQSALISIAGLTISGIGVYNFLERTKWAQEPEDILTPKVLLPAAALIAGSLISNYGAKGKINVVNIFNNIAHRNQH